MRFVQVLFLWENGCKNSGCVAEVILQGVALCYNKMNKKIIEFLNPDLAIAEETEYFEENVYGTHYQRK